MITSLFNYRIILSFVISAIVGLMIVVLLPIFSQHQSMLLVLPLAGVFFLMLVVNPRLTFVFVFLSRPLLDNALNLTKVSLGGQELGLGAILNMIIIVLAVFLYFYEGVFPRKNPVIRGWVVFFLVMMVAVIDSPYIGRAVRLYANYLSYFAMFLIPFLIIKRKEDFTFWVKVFAWSFVFPVMYANMDLALGGQFYADAGMRIKGSFSHPNVLAFYLCLGISYCFYLIKNKSLPLRRAENNAMIFLIVNMLVLLVATKTRNAWIACAVSFLIYGVLRDRKTVVVMFLMMPLLLLVPSIKDRVVTVFNGQGAVDYEGVNSFEWRLNMWKSSMPMIAKKPVLGYGLTSFKEMSPMFSEDRVSMGAHNVYVEVLFESGVIGLLAFLWLFYNPLKVFWMNMRKTKGQYQSVLWSIVVGYVLSYILICFADNLSYYLVFNWYVWFFIALMVISKRYMEPDKKNSATAIN